MYKYLINKLLFVVFILFLHLFCCGELQSGGILLFLTICLSIVYVVYLSLRYKKDTRNW